MSGVVIGLDHLVYATLTNDPASGTATYGTPIGIPGVIEVKINPNSSTATLFAENGPYEVETVQGQIAVDINVADLPLDVQAALFGHTIDANGVLIRKSNDVPPWVAIGFRSLKSNGKNRYTWLAKGKFSIPQQDNKTRADKADFQTPTATGSFVKRECDDEWERHIDEDSTGYTATQGTNWFNSPYGV